MSTLFASFPSLDLAEKAVGALLDQGANPEDVSLVANLPPDSLLQPKAEHAATHAESTAKTGITTTTAGDAVIGAEKGALVGVGVGILAALVALTVPGIGLVLGGGALVAAIGAAAGTTAAGAVAGGVAGFLADQGMGPEVITRYTTVFEAGGVIVGVAVPSGKLLPEFAEQILAKYQASDIATYNGSRTLMDREMPKPPLVIDNANLDPIVVRTPAPAAVVYPVVDTPATAAVVYPVAGDVVVPPTFRPVPDEVIKRAKIRPVLVDPVTGLVERAVLIDPLTELEHPIRYDAGVPVYVDSSPYISEHPVVTQESDTVVNGDDPTKPTITLTGSERVTIL